MSQGRHRLDLVAGTAVNAQGALALRLAAFRKLVPVACLSASSSVDDDAAWEGGGGKEVAELAQALASRLPTCSEVRWERWAGAGWQPFRQQHNTVRRSGNVLKRSTIGARSWHSLNLCFLLSSPYCCPGCGRLLPLVSGLAVGGATGGGQSSGTGRPG